MWGSGYYRDNAANNRGIDTIRELIRAARFKSIGGSNKAYIFDESHALTTDAGNALLKIVEEAPKHTYFIFCTTNPEKMLETLRNRCYRYEMKPLTGAETADLILHVMEKESIELPDEVIELIIEEGEGIARNVLVYLGKVQNVKNYSEAVDLIYSEKFQSIKVLDLCKKLIQPCEWIDIMDQVKGLDATDYENVRQQMVSIFGTRLSKAKSVEDVQINKALISNLVTPFSCKSNRGELLYRISAIYLMINDMRK